MPRGFARQSAPIAFDAFPNTGLGCTQSSMSRHQVILVPGFFGFGALGELTYFVGVKEALARAFAQVSLDVDVIEVPTLPTASIRHRAARVHETLADVAAQSDGPLHLIGHSTGGLDARLAITPNASLPSTRKFRAHERLRTLVTISTPHFGTPLASVFGSFAGYPVLRLIAAISTFALQRAHWPVGLGLRAGRWLTRADDRLGFSNTVADDLFQRVIADFSPERRAELIAFIDGVAKDQSLIFQLTAAGCDLLNACTADPDNLRYGSVVCSARAPDMSNVLAFRHNPYAQSMHALYAGLHRVASLAKQERYPEPAEQQRQALSLHFGQYPDPNWSDGIVPVLSQIWGEVIHCARADHLDVVGHYGSNARGRATTDWLPSRSGFDDTAFVALWASVARFITEEAREPDVPKHRENVGVERTQLERRETHPLDLVPPVVTAEERAREVLQELPMSAAPARAQ
jgi:triacylglycerol lipase